MSFTLPQLPYGYTALTPYIDAQTMEIHHTKHHMAYITNLNNAIAGTALEGKNLLDIVTSLDMNNKAVRNNAGGHYNHSLFWETIGGANAGIIEGEIATAINEAFGSFEAFKEAFSKAALTQFGSGWAWLSVKDGKLEVSATPNQDNPLMPSYSGATPILGIDVWEHAYYLNYQNRRADYIAAFFNIINWKKVNELFLQNK